METVNNIMLSPERMMIALGIRIILLVIMILKTKIHTFWRWYLPRHHRRHWRYSYDDIIKSITGGFGGTLGSIGIVIGFGVMMGSILKPPAQQKPWLKPFLKCSEKEKRRSL